MNLARALRLWLIGLFATTATVTIAYLWLDKPIALWVHEHIRHSHYGILGQAVRIGDPFVPAAIIGFLFFGFRILIGRSLSNWQAATFVSCSSILVAETIKDGLKYISGRSWPETWTHGNASFIRDGVYGFHLLHGGDAYQSFPSGHMGATCALLMVLWFWFPQFRWLYLFAGLSVGGGLVLGNYHFLGDVIAGAFVGISSGCATMEIWYRYCSIGGR
jgi:membrane-associated phospholipid phosphatase